MTNEELEKELKIIQNQINHLEKSFNATIKIVHDFFSQHAGLIQNNSDNIEQLAKSLDVLFNHIVKAIDNT